ncbi:MAG: ABC transporter permease [Bacillota bacterium]|nr:ABC transporter permease [Bacillota bacterium]
MYILENAWKSIVRNKGRNILIGVIFIVISCAVSITLAISNASSTLIESYESKYELKATISMNRNNMFKDFNPEDRENSKLNMKELFSNASNISVEDVEKYGNSEYVKSYYYTASVQMDAKDLEKASQDMGGSKDFGMKMFDGDFSETSTGDFTIKGYSSIDAMNEFIEGSYTITEGEVSEDFDSNSCLVNSQLATLNGLKVGDTITLVDVSDESKEYEMVIFGIFEEKNEGMGMNMFSNSANTIITNANYVLKMDSENVSINPTFVLHSKEDIEAFEKELSQKGLDENLMVETNLDQVEGATSTISNVKTFALTFLVITLIIGTIVLLVINMINIRERKYEIGVLRTIGMKKKSVCLQFITELCIVASIALTVGAGIGASLSLPVSNRLLENEITSSMNEQFDIRENFGKSGSGFGNMPGGFKSFNGVANVQAFESIDATVDLKVLVELLLIGLLLTLLSSISAIASIQKFSPLTILKERS